MYKVSFEYADAYSNWQWRKQHCTLEARNEDEAVEKAKEYADSEGWDYVETKEVSEVQREKYLDDDEILEVYDEACDYGISGMFYTWPDEDEE